MNKTKSYRKKRRKTQRRRWRKTQRRQRKQMRGGSIEIGSLTTGNKGTFEFYMMNIEDLGNNRKAYEDHIRKFGCSFLDSSDIDIILDSYLDTKDYALDSGIRRYADNTHHNKVFFLYFVEPSDFPFTPPTKTMIGFISCSIYIPRNICYVKWECSNAKVIKKLVTVGDRRVERASHVLQAFFINYLASMGVTAIYKQLRTYDHPDNGPDENRGTLTPRYMIAKYNLDTAFKLFTKRQANDIDNLTFLQLQNDHYSKFDISQFNRVHPTLLGQRSEYPTIDNGIDLLKMLDDAKRYEDKDEIDRYIVSLKTGGYSHIERLMYMRDLCNMLNMNGLYTRKTKEYTEKILPAKANISKGSKKKKSLFDDDL